MVVNGELPKNVSIMFRVGAESVDLLAENNVIYTEKDLSPYTCQRLKQKNEIGLMEVVDQSAPPKHLTNVAYQIAC